MEKKNQKWDRWAKKRTFVRALEGNLQPPLQDAERGEAGLLRAGTSPGRGGPPDVRQERDQPRRRPRSSSQSNPTSRPTRPRPVARSMATSNSAVFYVLKGHGYDVSRRPQDSMEGRRRDAGRERLRAPALQRLRQGGMHSPRVQGPSRLFLFMHLLLQKMVEWPPDLDPALGPYSPPKDL